MVKKWQNLLANSIRTRPKMSDSKSPDALLSGLFHPLTARWFNDAVGEPTDIQARAWPEIARGGHLLMTAPTGSGKTLTAFLYALDRLVSGHWSCGRTSVLYVSPLKALNNDIQRNLLQPLAGLRQRFEAEGLPLPSISVLTRSGDTPQSDRQRMLRHPPEILITTPESLNLLLSSRGGRGLLTSLKTVILDEIHAVVGSKRGVHLMTAVERLVDLSGEFQRLALSATVHPLDQVAALVGGFTLTGPDHAPVYTPRPVQPVVSRTAKDYRISVRFPEEVVDRQISEAFWKALAVEFKKVIGRNRSTLLFVNSRRLTEKLTLKINKGESGGPVAYAHHGSLSREIRTEVEHSLKNGRLKAIVATSSLEMGIDIGDLDEVVLIQSPFSISAAIQRIGRAGHGVGRVSAATMFPTHAHDFLTAAVLARAVIRGDIEAVRPVEGALDVLAQVIISMTGMDEWDMDRLFNSLRRARAYRNLTREQFDLTLNMLAGRYADTRLRELRPRVSIDRAANTVVAAKGALLSLYTSGGTIPDRGYYQLRVADSGALIGDLDEEFVWEAKVGQTFLLGTQTWKIERITHNDVLVGQGRPGSAAAPFWKAEGGGRDAHFSGLVAGFLARAEEELAGADGRETLLTRLAEEHYLEESAGRQLADYLIRQRAETKRPLPHRSHILVEHIASGPGGGPGNQVVIHNVWGGAVNRPYAYALAAAWQCRFGQKIEIFPGDDCLALVLPTDIDAGELLGLVGPGQVEELLLDRLEGSGFFGARFREAAGRALLITRQRFGRRLPLWMNRLKSQKLLDAVRPYGDFPMVLEAWRSCLRDEFDLPALEDNLARLASGRTAWSEAWTGQPSPMARGLAWDQINRYMYMADKPDGPSASSLQDDLLAEVVFNPGLRPAVDPELATDLETKLQRLHPGYSPSGGRELHDWVAERLLLTARDWARLLAALQRDQGPEAEQSLANAAPRLVALRPPEAAGELIASRDELHRLAGLWDGAEVRVRPLDGSGGETVLNPPTGSDEAKGEAELDLAATNALAQWLRFFGPLTPERIARDLGLPPGRLRPLLDDLIQAGTVVSGRLLRQPEGQAGPDLVCDAANFEILLRLARAGARPDFHTLPATGLAPFLARIQGLTDPAQEADGLALKLDQLAGLGLKAGAWEAEVLPARSQGYQPLWLDSLTATGGLMWLGTGEGRITPVVEEDLDLVCDGETAEEGSPVEDLFPDPHGQYDFQSLARTTGLPADRLADRLWAGVWTGRLTNDSFAALRHGVETGFKTDSPAQAMEKSSLNGPAARRGRRGGLRRGFNRWQAGLPSAGAWRLVNRPAPPTDALAADELDRERARLLLDRYGVLFRELVAREEAPFIWSRIFRALRLMELAGEVLAGHFFLGPTGPQFCTLAAFQILVRAAEEGWSDDVIWLNAVDPASLCGLGLEPLKGTLPRRLPGNHLVYHGPDLVLVSERNGSALTFHVPPDAPRLTEYLVPLHHLLGRRVGPLRSIRIQTINDRPPGSSPYLAALQTAFDVVSGPRDVVIYQRH